MAARRTQEPPKGALPESGPMPLDTPETPVSGHLVRSVFVDKYLTFSQVDTTFRAAQVPLSAGFSLGFLDIAKNEQTLPGKYGTGGDHENGE